MAPFMKMLQGRHQRGGSGAHSAARSVYKPAQGGNERRRAPLEDALFASQARDPSRPCLCFVRASVNAYLVSS